MSDLSNRDPQSTQWSLIDRAGDARSTVRRPAVEELVRRYVPALRAHLLFRMKLDPSTADDVVQGFLADRLLTGRLTANASPTKGRFRSLLVRALENYTIDVLRRNRREDSVESSASVVEDRVGVEPCRADIFDAAWARQVLVLSLREMRRQCEAQLCESRWRLFERRVLRPLLEHESPPTYEVLVQEFQFKTPQQASNALVSAKRHFQRVLEQIVAEYIDDDAQLANELSDLRAIVSAAGPMGIRLHLLDDASVENSDALPESNSCDGELLATMFDDDAVHSPWGADDYRGLWSHQLAQPVDAVLQADSPVRTSPPMGGAVTVADLYRSAEPSLEELRRLKEIARGHVRAGRSDVPAEIATALYFAAIAAAIARYGERITKSDDSVLEHGLRILLTRSWLDAETRELLHFVWSQLSV